MLDHWNSKAVLLRVEPDGTRVYRKNNKILRVTRDLTPEQRLRSSYYPPGGRAALYRGAKDPRNTAWFAEAVRERRKQGFKAGVRPGPQCL